jgi:pentatricopeptide repeat protein
MLYSVLVKLYTKADKWDDVLDTFTNKHMKE